MMHDFDRATVLGCWGPNLFSNTFQETVLQGGDFLFQMEEGKEHLGILGAETALGAPKDRGFPK